MNFSRSRCKKAQEAENAVFTRQTQPTTIMKTKRNCFFTAMALLALLTINPQLSTAFAQGTAFTYQGRLNAAGSPASGNYDLSFTLFNTNVTGTVIAGPVTNSATAVSNGLFTTTIDFGPGVFTGGSNWLEIAVSTNGANSFTTLAPRQQLTPTPYAVYAESANAANLVGTVPLPQLPGAVLTNNESSVTLSNLMLTGALNLPAITPGSPAIIYSGSGLLLYGDTNRNLFSGQNAGNLTTSGNQNTANGVQALEFNASGSDNTANGYQALEHNTSGYNNTANGRAALYSNTSGSDNTANGRQALESNMSGNENTASGVNALFNLGNSGGAGGTNNIALGFQAGANFFGNESGNIDIGNPGVQGENNIIRLGTPGVQTATILAGTVTATSFSGDGSGLTSLPAANLTGSVPPASLPGVALLNGGNTFSGAQNINDSTDNNVLNLSDTRVGALGSGAQINLGDDFSGSPESASIGSVGNGGGFTWRNGALELRPVSRVNIYKGSDVTSAGTVALTMIGSSGNVGIGTSTPANKLDVQGSADFSGSVGIGTTTPAAGLDVEVSAAVSGGSWSYFQNGTINTGSFGGSPSLAIYTAGAMGASTYYAFSDARIKNIIGVSSGAKDLQTLRTIEVTDFTYKDTVANGSRQVKKVIAQQVESVYPQAVSQTTGVVPDIFQPASEQDGWVKLATNLKVGERVKLISQNGQGIYPVLETRDGAFRTDFKPATEKVFVYGREVNDFRNVDYEALTTLNVSATQELAKKLDAQQAALNKLQEKLDQTLAEKETLLKHLAALEARDQAREDRLARIERDLEKSSVPAKYAALNVR